MPTVTQRRDCGAGREVRAEDGRYIMECSRCGIYRDTLDDGETPILSLAQAELIAESHDSAECYEVQRQARDEWEVARAEEQMGR